MQTYIVIILLGYIISLIFTREFIVVCAREGGANTTSFLAAHFAKRNTKFGGGGKRGRAKIPSPQPPSFLPARAFSLAREAWQSEIAVRIFVKKSSDFNQKAPPIFRIRILGDCRLAPPEAGLGFGKDFEGIFEIQKQFLPAQTEVRRAKHG